VAAQTSAQSRFIRMHCARSLTASSPKRASAHAMQAWPQSRPSPQRAEQQVIHLAGGDKQDHCGAEYSMKPPPCWLRYSRRRTG
jgi:hypothetical protein